MKKSKKIERQARKERLVIYITSEMKESLQNASASEDDTVSQYAFRALKKHLEERN